MTNKIKPYKKDFNYSYTSGAYTTIELIKARPETAECVYIHSSYRDHEGLTVLCGKKEIRCVQSDKAFSVVNQKENSYVLGVFQKYTGMLAANEPHIVLINPSDMGNLGTIIRSMAGMNINNLAIIEPAADVWNPKTIRASMGALFHIRHSFFPSFEAYREHYPTHSCFPFMLTGRIAPEEAPPGTLFSLIFGNEASGLDERFFDIGRCVKIPLTCAVDSFNLSVAVGIGAYIFARKNDLI